MIYRLLRRVAVLLLATAAGHALAGVVTLSGNLGDSANSALVASDLSAPQFTDDLATANNVALYSLQVLVGGSASFTSTGFALGGIDPYVTVFSGTDRATATFLESNYVHAFSIGGDFTMPVVLAAGDYTVAIGVFANMSFADQDGGGPLSYGFTGLGVPDVFGDGSYTLTVTLPDVGTVPEPGGALLTLTAACVAVWARRRRQALTTNGGR